MTVNTKPSSLPRHSWYLADAQLAIRDLQQLLWPLGYHIALGGGVLNHGYSDKDLDLYVLPTYREPGCDGDNARVLAVLDTYFGSGAQGLGAGSLDGTWPHDCFDTSCKYEDSKGRRIDVFVVKR